MNQMAKQIGILAAILIVSCLICRFFMNNTYTAYIPTGGDRPDAGEAELRPESGLEIDRPEAHDGYMTVHVKPDGPGATFVELRDEEGRLVEVEEYHVGQFLTVYDRNTGGFTGDTMILIMITVFSVMVAVIMFSFYMRREGPDFYSYSTIYAAGFSLFAMLTGLLGAYMTVRHLLTPAGFAMRDAYRLITMAGYFFIIATLPLIFAFSVWLAVSNIALLRHERYRLQNVLGLIAAFAMLGGAFLAVLLFRGDYSGMNPRAIVHETAASVYATVYVYFECMLFGAVICGLRAARHVPSFGRDFIIILGCSFRKDGTLPPLLRGRADRACEFWLEQKEQTGKEAVLIPSGGQGKNESMPAAEAISRYLLSRGVPEGAIMKEDRSRNTYENMAFSKKLIEGIMPDAKTVFVTTNYHVFRSGVWANLAGLAAEGAGSPTKWWFWPNAFMRECAGLLRNRIRQEAVMLVLQTAFFAVMAILLAW